MSRFSNFILCIVLLITFNLPASLGRTQEQPSSDQNSVDKNEIPAASLDLANIVPLAAQLMNRLAVLEKKNRRRPEYPCDRK